MNPSTEEKGPSSGQQTTAEQDMELIRIKRATSTAAANGTTGQTKSKYRKRSVSLVLSVMMLMADTFLSFFNDWGSSAQVHQGNVILVIYEKLPNGVEDLMERGRCVMRVVYVRVFFSFLLFVWLTPDVCFFLRLRQAYAEAEQEFY